MTTILPLRPTLRDCERQILADALKAEGTQKQRAQALGIPLRTLFHLLRRHRLAGGL
jgi:DNA-binding NtrC family response regulator